MSAENELINIEEVALHSNDERAHHFAQKIRSLKDEAYEKLKSGSELIGLSAMTGASSLALLIKSEGHPEMFAASLILAGGGGFILHQGIRDILHSLHTQSEANTYINSLNQWYLSRQTKTITQPP
ncbi:MAG: hypothetical protein US86_C0013G0016 [Candidatus Daviesbacteria bacterium GW2011_GWA2_38_24]|uniref:Uncharacterized protein n=1 Tax=Candidatus Daviesbacteria bacterium GW2011_GWA2_38_24 TaxID=1618422 RepID=A0A0G0JPH1_9BACT|nr:MAG: hypothetical protein US86_C0013G0016 [Candidatus Daviesbacteria bacterium GW2011_GWA2_38_24]KKQ79878.1 MAG: hypothetical protein UT01_C0025G0011 [Candidatus Daviesbacteria bacterium GW2011_GWA1_38_7]OGE23079.1 MAG: hypothetical protein A2688_03705 [Candidatus Daviesbacteria bacterium RIFCSPHIGHO2_01_FULL_38_8]